MENIKWLFVSPETPLKDILDKQNNAGKHGLPAGIVIVVDKTDKIIGTITDGDVRRSLIKNSSINQKANDIMNSSPIYFSVNEDFQNIIKLLPKRLEQKNRRSKRFLGQIILVDHDSIPVKILNYHQLWEQNVATHRHIVVFGLGYVGLTLALKLSEIGFKVTGIDKVRKIVSNLNDGTSHVHEPGINDLLKQQLKNNLTITTDIPRNGDVYIVAVGTPIVDRGDNKIPNLDFLLEAANDIGKNLSFGDLVILRSTVPVGTTSNHFIPLLEKTSDLKVGSDFHIAFAPERTIEGKALQELRSLPQIVGGFNRDSVESTVAIFRELTPLIVRVKSIESAELSKLINNCFRDLTFAFSNQLAHLASRFNIDINECIQDANSNYPRDLVPRPSPGVGGPCLSKDPYILSSQLYDSNTVNLSLFEHGRDINENMIDFSISRLIKQMDVINNDISSLNILICGMAFKGYPDTSDLRDSVSVAFYNRLKKINKNIKIHDYVVKDEDLKLIEPNTVKLPNGFYNVDVVLFLNNHPSYASINCIEMVEFLNSPFIIFDGWSHFNDSDFMKSKPGIYMGLSHINDNLNQ